MGDGESLLSGYRALDWEVGKVLEVDAGDGCVAELDMSNGLNAQFLFNSA